MATKFNIVEHTRALRHLDSMTLLSYRDALREANLTVVKHRVYDDGEKVLIGSGAMKLVPLIDTTRLKDRVYMVPSPQEKAMDHHIAVNFLLRERGFTSRIDENPELTLDIA